MLRAVRTLVISDLHLGSRLAHDVLRRPDPLARLLAALDGIDRLVFLGDTVELMEGRARLAMAIADPILRAIGARLGPSREVIIVAGNHDRPFVRPAIRARGAELTACSELAPDTSPALAHVIDCLRPAPVRVHYPGVWLSDRIWATHGHYLDQHLIPQSAVGVTRSLLGRAPHSPATPIDYERRRRLSLGRTTRWMPRPFAALLDDAAEMARASTMPKVSRTLLNHRISPLTAAALSLQMRRASIPAIVQVMRRLGVDAESIIFGHVHRLGPLGGDDPIRWCGRGGSPRVFNTGSWLYEPKLVHHATPPHPYWPGGSVLIDGESEPRAVGLLDELIPAQLHPLATV